MGGAKGYPSTAAAPEHRHCDSRINKSDLEVIMSGTDRVVSYTRLQDCTQADIELQAEEYGRLTAPDRLTARVLRLLTAQRGVTARRKVDLLEHALQAATRAYKDGADEEVVVCCLLYNLGELLSPHNHGEVAAAFLKPYISAANYWILAHHEVFTSYYYLHHLSGDRNRRDVYKSSPHYSAAVKFVDKYIEPSFDPDYESMDVEFFTPSVVNIFSRKPYHNDPTNPKAPAVTGNKDT